MAEWCDLADVEDVLSANGLSASTNDNQGNAVSDPDIVENAIKRARVKLSQYLVQKYDLSTITSANEWVNQATAVYAAVWILRRNSGSVSMGLQAEYNELVEFLNGVQSGSLIVPGLNQRGMPGIGVVSITIDNAYGRAKVREVGSISFPENRQSSFPKFTDRFDYGKTQ